MTFRTRAFITALATAAVTLAVTVILVSWSVRRSVGERIERDLVNEARLAAETLSHRQPATLAELDAEADAIGQLVSARVTFIAPDGRVVGDSGVSADGLVTLENQCTGYEGYAGEQDTDPTNATDCKTASDRGTIVHAAELQVY